jgi:MSHA biogenesis protein MshK
MKLVLLLIATTVQAAPFADPFRPPRQVEGPGAERAAPAAATRLESVLIGPDRRIAVINGQQYTEGARYGSGRVLRISEAEVIIRHADRDERLKLFPQGVKK